MKWTEKDKKVYQKILDAADEVKYISGTYYNGCMHMRNRAMAEAADFCIAYLVKKCGGTFYSVNYARELKLNIVNLAEGYAHPPYLV